MPLTALNRRALLITGASALSFACSARPDAPNSGADTSVEARGAWTAGPALPYAAQEIYPAFHHGKIHLAGGFIAEADRISGVTDRHIALDLDSGTWSDLAALPMPRHHPNLISFQDRLLAIGGFEAHGEDAAWVMQSSVWTFDGDGWSDGPGLPQPNGESVLGVVDGILHTCGGRNPRAEANASWNDHTDIGDHFVLSGLDASWERAAPLPTPRNSAAAAVIGSQMHIVGGRTVADGNTGAHEVYDAREDRWRTAAPMPQGQGGLAAAAVGGQLYAFGGEYFIGGGGVYPECWTYDPATDAWQAIPDMPHPRHGLGAVTVDDAIYVIGGALRVGGNQTSDLVEIYRP
ncbi:MAG: kelch repeat-containing protein [Pseudomonadota bacterium]|nr:kelch repeat-containing protein [Pseudomonadota bacterium]